MNAEPDQPMSINEIDEGFETLLFKEMDESPDAFPQKKPLLAHYMPISKFESLLSNQQIWLSNPLNMNDWQEVRFGINEGAHAFRLSEVVRKSCQTDERYLALRNAFEDNYDKFCFTDASQIYAFCASEHEPPEDNDGLLSMWRAYGDDANGVAVIFDTSVINGDKSSPFVIKKIFYGTDKERLALIHETLKKFAQHLELASIPTEKLYIAANNLFLWIKIFAVFSKQYGFREEKEWRIAYFGERDTENKAGGFMSYFLGVPGIESKLKYPIAELKNSAGESHSLNSITRKIILGPTHFNPLALDAVKKMLNEKSHAELIPKLVSSTIPYRSR